MLAVSRACAPCIFFQNVDMGGGSKGKQTEGKGHRQVQDCEEVKQEVVKEKTMVTGC